MKDMQFDKWFYSQSRILQIILLLIPVVGWIMELLIRFSVMRRTKSVVHIVVFIVFVVVGWALILCVVDLIWWLVKGHLILAD